MPVHTSYKILFLPKWYPNRTDKFNGIFTERHAKAIAARCKTAVLFVGPDNVMNTSFETEISYKHNLKIVCVY